jgi:hypothetical protein
VIDGLGSDTLPTLEARVLRSVTRLSDVASTRPPLPSAADAQAALATVLARYMGAPPADRRVVAEAARMIGIAELGYGSVLWEFDAHVLHTRATFSGRYSAPAHFR